MAIQNRRGPSAKFDPSKLLPGEWAVKLDTKEIYICYAAGDVRRMATYEEMMENINMATEDVQAMFTADVRSAIQAATTAASSANSAATSANSAANNASTAAADAVSARQQAMQAAYSASTNAAAAESAAQAATTAASSANTAATAANTAADTANAAIANMKSSKILWRGGLLYGGTVEFYIPESCFHNNGTTVTLVIESYMRANAQYADLGTSAIIVPLSIGAASDFGLSGELNESTYYPYSSGGYSMATVYKNIHGSTAYSTMIDIDIMAKKVPDSRYAVCRVSTDGVKSSADIIITNISAYIPEDM